MPQKKDSAETQGETRESAQAAATAGLLHAHPGEPEAARVRSELGGEDGRGLEHLREILFGAAYREFERRLARIDANLTARAHELQQESRKRADVLQGHLEREVEAMASRLSRELKDTGDTVQGMNREQRDGLLALEKRMGKMEETLSGAQRDLRHQLLEQAKTFLDEIQRARQELLATFERELGLLEADVAEGAPHAHEEHRPI